MIKENDLVAVAAVWWGREIPVDDCLELVNNQTPEDILIAKQALSHLSNEAKRVVKLLVDIPEELFFSNGKIKLPKLRIILRKELHWNPIKIQKVERELKNYI